MSHAANARTARATIRNLSLYQAFAILFTADDATKAAGVKA